MIVVATLLLLKSLLPYGGYCSLELHACRPKETVQLHPLIHDIAMAQQNVSTLGLVWCGTEPNPAGTAGCRARCNLNCSHCYVVIQFAII